MESLKTESLKFFSSLRFFFCFLILLVVSAKADMTPNDMRKYANEVPKMLLEEGRANIGKVDIEQLISEIDQVQFKIFSGGFLAGSGEQRSSAINFIKNHTVLVNKLSLPLIPNGYELLIFLHESLEAWGYIDEDYQVTLSLVLSLKSIQARLDFDLDEKSTTLLFLENIQKRDRDVLYKAEGGGGTSVGGGGDAIALQVKLLCILAAKDWLTVQQKQEGFPKMTHNDLIQKMLGSSFEVSFDLKAAETQTSKKDQKLLFRVQQLHWLNSCVHKTQGLILNTALEFFAHEVSCDKK